VEIGGGKGGVRGRIGLTLFARQPRAAHHRIEQAR
jgi:hypothetical protein